MIALAVLYLAGASAERRLLQGETESILAGLRVSYSCMDLLLAKKQVLSGRRGPSFAKPVMPENLY